VFARTQVDGIWLTFQAEIMGADNANHPGAKSVENPSFLVVVWMKGLSRGEIEIKAKLPDY